MFFYIETLGCKVNQYESAAIAELLRGNGHIEVQKSEPRDVSIVNTCAVTGDASRQSRQTARRLRREFPDAKLVICGCASQIEPDAARELGADLVAGAGDKRGLVGEIERLIDENSLRHAARDTSLREGGLPPSPRGVSAEPTGGAFEPLPSASIAGRTRAMLKIQDGCDNFCSYCVIPYARGRVRSLPVAAIADEAKSLASQGFAEIVLTGIEICSYGRDLDSETLIDAIRAAASAAPTARLRLGSLEPSCVTDEFVTALAAIPNLCDHFHLSLQSGSDGVLKRMRRKYGTAEFFAALKRLRTAYPNCGVTADVIAGFPGETDAEHAETVAFLERCAFSAAHVFPYSKRPGTPAAAMENQLPNAVKKARAAELRAVAAATGAAFAASQVGRVLEVLFEREADGGSVGHSSNYLEVRVLNAGIRGKTLAVSVAKAVIERPLDGTLINT
ncbi:MAG: tRNA (N(6)-L-threonylcarbamoyladenosine(37)-C(2))-methylthiotransferase MtaB [Oscillospiraceae bacterium]|jgi:threonylcarbamoyladenosine tRNA methylthiotransferase MtaB|nr:tRNA (N(6)-L-threonylcarbamoyladenosine(37)-C(2))-methylthiotransferase MtaB [Oscillospiraceae bacterium]